MMARKAADVVFSIGIVFALCAGWLEVRPAGQGSDKPAFQRAPDAIERVTWRTRTLVGDDRLTRWKFAVPATGVAAPTFLDAVVRAEAAVVDFVEGSSTQKVSASVQKNLDYNLTKDEITTLRERMGPIRMLTYRVDMPGDPATQRKVFEFAKAMAVDTIVVPRLGDASAVDVLAGKFEIKVAVLADSANPAALVNSLEERSRLMGIGIDTSTWTRERVSPSDGLGRVKGRLLYVFLGEGAKNLRDFFLELDRQNIRPLAMTLDTRGIVNAPGDLFKAIDAFEAAVQPAFGVNFVAFSRTRPIRWDLVTPRRDEKLTPEEMKTRADETARKIDAAIPKKAFAAPKKKRKLLVLESLHGMSHNTIPHTNLMIKRMGEITGAWETVFDNNLENLKYPKIKEYDAVFLNSTVGEMLPDLEVRAGLARFVREGGGLGGVHGTPWASRNWDEFAEMIGAQSAPHRIEQGVMRVYDRDNPIVKPLGAKPINFREEYYRFEHEGRGRLQWDKVRVLLTVDLDDPKIEPRPWNGYKRPDNIYPVTWIRTYGKGRVFYSSLGHMEETFMTPEIVGHFLAGFQYMLGDLDANATPNPRS